MYTFPGLGLGALIANAKLVTRGMLLAASLELAEQVRQHVVRDNVPPDPVTQVPQERLDRGLIFPDLDTIRGVTQSIAVKGLDPQALNAIRADRREQLCEPPKTTRSRERPCLKTTTSSAPSSNTRSAPQGRAAYHAVANVGPL